MLKTSSQFRVVSSAQSGMSVIPGNPVDSRPLAVKASAQYKETANILTPLMSGGGANNMSVNMLPQGSLMYDTMLSGMVSDNEKANYRFYRDIYSYDTVAGSAVDLMATMPFSPFQLDGCNNAERTKVYMAAIESLNFKTLLPEIAVDFMVMGSSTLTPIYKADEKRFVDIIPWQAENVTVTPTPFIGIDPLITITPDQVLKSFLTFESEYFRKLRQNMSTDILDALRSSYIELDPLSTIHLPRKSYTFDHVGTSYYRRILPLYLIEKALYRGTLIEAGRRQRAMLHLSIGGDNWHPTAEEIQAVVGLFQQADFDPLGAIVGTRNDIQASELRCLSENAMVAVSGRGLVALKDLVPDPDFKPDNKPRSWDLQNVFVKGVGNEYRKVESIQYQGERPVSLYNFSNGASLAATTEHGVLLRRKGSNKCVLAAVGSLIPADPEEISSGSSVVVHSDIIAIHELQEILNSRFMGFTNLLVLQDKNSRTFTADPVETMIYMELENTSPYGEVSVKDLKAGKAFPGLWDLFKKVLPSDSSSALWVLESGMSFAKFVGTVGSSWVCHTYDLTMENFHEPFFMVDGETGGVLTKNSGGDFWKYTDIADLTLPMKMRGLGISENFLSQEASYAAVDASLAVFTENLRHFRTNMAQRIFYGKLFPLIAYTNDFFTKDYTEAQQNQFRETAALGEIKLKHQLNDATMLDMPVIHWEKALRPEVDQAHLETLSTLKQNGVPVGIATWAAAGGVSAEDLLKEVKSDVELKKQIAEITGKDPDAAEDGDEFARVAASLQRGPIGVLNRGPFQTEYYETTPTGKKKHIINQAAAHNKAYATLEKALVERAKNPQSHYNMVATLEQRGGIPDITGGGGTLPKTGN